MKQPHYLDPKYQYYIKGKRRYANTASRKNKYLSSYHEGDIHHVNYEEGEDTYIPSYCHKNEPLFVKVQHDRVIEKHGDQDFEDRIGQIPSLCEGWLNHLANLLKDY